MTHKINDILPASLVPASKQKTYATLKKLLTHNIGTTTGSKRIKEAMIADMTDIFNAINWNKLKKEKLEHFTTMVNAIKKTKKSTSYKKVSVPRYTGREGGPGSCDAAWDEE